MNFTRDDVKLTLYKVLDKGKKEESKRIQKLGHIAHGKAIEIEMEDYYPIDHLVIYSFSFILLYLVVKVIYIP